MDLEQGALVLTLSLYTDYTSIVKNSEIIIYYSLGETFPF